MCPDFSSNPVMTRCQILQCQILQLILNPILTVVGWQKGKTAKLNKGLQSPLKVSDVEQHIAKLNRHINVHFSKVKPTCISHNGDKTYQILAIPI